MSNIEKWLSRNVLVMIGVVVLCIAFMADAQQPAKPIVWEYGTLTLYGSGGEWQTESKWETMKENADRGKFIKTLTGRDVPGSRIGVLNALATHGWEVVDYNISGQSDIYLLKRKAQ
jgi:hypothetical protein